MDTKKQAEKTNPLDTFGTTPSVPTLINQTDYSGTKLKDRYVIESELGRGGIGVVYLARDTQLMQRRVVIKVLLESSENSLHTPWFRKKFEQEIEALVRIDHPGVVGVLDVGTMPDGKPFFVMQFVEGTNLRTVMQNDMPKGKLDFTRVANIVRQIGTALTAAHEKGIIHRDLKPENVMVQKAAGGDEVIKLIDFGIATVKDSQTTQAEGGKTKVAGALPYMAPEQLRGEPEAASDTWSLAVMAYELLTGRLPFQADTLVQLHEHQRNRTSPLPTQFRKDLPPAAEHVLVRALSFEASERHPRARDFGEALAETLFQTVPLSLPTNTLQQLPLTPSTPTQPSAPTLIDGNAVIDANAVPGAAPPVVAPPAPTKTSRPYVVPAIVLLVALIGAIGWWKMSDTTTAPVPDKPTPVVTEPSRTLNYSLSVRLKKNAAGAPVDMPGEVIFSPGDEVRFKIISPQDGYLYIIGEGPQPDPKTKLPLYNLLFPKPDPTTAQIKADQLTYLPSETGPGFFVDKEQGAEKIWLVWAQNSLSDLEQLKKWYNDKDQGAINSDADTTKLRDFLQSNIAARPVAEKGSKQMMLKGGQSDLLIYAIELAHY